MKIRKLSQGNLSLAEGDLEWTDSVTEKPKAELLHSSEFNFEQAVESRCILCYSGTGGFTDEVEKDRMPSSGGYGVGYGFVRIRFQY